MDIKKTVTQYYAEWIAHKGPSWAKCMTKALEDQAAGYEQRIDGLTLAMKAEESAHTHTLSQRDRAENAADELANAIAAHFRVDIGEHSNANDPWEEALCVISGEYVTDSDADRQLAESAKRIRQLEAERYGMALVPRKLLGKFPELNTNNYSHDDVDELNSWGIELLLASVPRRCSLCDYRHGHRIGCKNNPVDIAMLAAAPQPKKEGE